MATKTYKRDDWTITVQSERPGDQRKDRWDASAYRGDSRLVTGYWYSTHDDAFNAINDMIHTEQCHEERWRDYFNTLAQAGFSMVMQGKYDLEAATQQLIADHNDQQAYMQEGQKYVDNKEVNQ
jgi:hypothetical protein